MRECWQNSIVLVALALALWGGVCARVYSCSFCAMASCCVQEAGSCSMGEECNLCKAVPSADLTVPIWIRQSEPVQLPVVCLGHLRLALDKQHGVKQLVSGCSHGSLQPAKLYLINRSLLI